MAFVMGDEEGLVTARRMDATIAELPGMEGISLVADAVKEALDRLGISREPAAPMLVGEASR